MRQCLAPPLKRAGHVKRRITVEALNKELLNDALPPTTTTTDDDDDDGERRRRRRLTMRQERRSLTTLARQVRTAQSAGEQIGYIEPVCGCEAGKRHSNALVSGSAQEGITYRLAESTYRGSPSRQTILLPKRTAIRRMLSSHGHAYSLELQLLQTTIAPDQKDTLAGNTVTVTSFPLKSSPAL